MITIIKKFFVWLDDIVFGLTNLLFWAIPLVMLIGGGFIPVIILLSWYFEHKINLADLRIVLFGLLLVWMGIRWHDVVKNYSKVIKDDKL